MSTTPRPMFVQRNVVVKPCLLITPGRKRSEGKVPLLEEQTVGGVYGTPLATRPQVDATTRTGSRGRGADADTAQP
jgi:hypothetical protein